jgi:hypothetical protein
MIRFARHLMAMTTTTIMVLPSLQQWTAPLEIFGNTLRRSANTLIVISKRLLRSYSNVKRELKAVGRRRAAAGIREDNGD